MVLPPSGEVAHLMVAVNVKVVELRVGHAGHQAHLAAGEAVGQICRHRPLDCPARGANGQHVVIGNADGHPRVHTRLRLDPVDHSVHTLLLIAKVHHLHPVVIG